MRRLKAEIKKIIILINKMYVYLFVRLPFVSDEDVSDEEYVKVQHQNAPFLGLKSCFKCC